MLDDATSTSTLRPSKTGLGAELGDLVVDARRYGQLELILIRREIASAVRQGMIIVAALLIASVIGLIGFFILAQTAVVALSPYIGGPVYAGLAVGLVLIGLTAALISYALRRPRLEAAPRSRILHALVRTQPADVKPPVSDRALAIEADAARRRLDRTTERLKGYLTPTQIVNQILQSIYVWTKLEAHLRAIAKRHPVVAGSIGAAAAWLVLPAERKPARQKRESKLSQKNSRTRMESSDASNHAR